MRVRISPWAPFRSSERDDRGTPRAAGSLSPSGDDWLAGRYFAGDGAKRDEDGDLWLLGRVDDVMNISGHRISTTEVEHALVGGASLKASEFSQILKGAIR